MCNLRTRVATAGILGRYYKPELAPTMLACSRESRQHLDHVVSNIVDVNILISGIHDHVVENGAETDEILIVLFGDVFGNHYPDLYRYVQFSHRGEQA
jgi:hypothetical protein